MRTGPKPLPLHMSLASSPQFTQAQRVGLLSGIKLYQSHPYRAHRAAREVVWKSDDARVLYQPAQNAQREEKRPLILIPSLINRSHILDLCEEQTMMGWFAAQGHDVYLLDWGNAGKGAHAGSMSFLIEELLVPAIQLCAQHANALCAALGYCMGGTLLVGASSQIVPYVDRCVFLSTPWDFHAGAAEMGAMIEKMRSEADVSIRSRNLLPAEWTQSVFAQLDPQMAVQKFSRFAQMRQDSPEAHLFVAVEDWLNDGVDLSAGIAQECLHDWFVQNLTGTGEWQVGAAPVKPETLKTPSLIIASSRDKLVDIESSRSLYNKLPNATFLQPDCGHIGMLAGRKCIKEVWRPIQKFISQ